LSSTGCVERYLWHAESVLREDLDSLSREYSVEERVELWNKLREAYRDYVEDCAPRLDRELDRAVRGKMELAMLMVAASLKRDGVEIPGVTDRFSSREFEAIEYFEKLKSLDHLSKDDIVELLERRRGEVYRLIREYYDRQYHLLDNIGDWSDIRGNLARSIAAHYRERRRKIEEAVREYMSRRPLTAFLDEIVDTAEKTAELTGRAMEALEKAENAVAKAEDALASGSPPSTGELEKALNGLRSVRGQLEEALENVRDAKSNARGAARSMLELEESHVSRTLEAVDKRIREMERILEELKLAAAALEEEESRGRRVSWEEAWGLEEAITRRLAQKIRGSHTIYDPRSGKERRVKFENIEYTMLDPNSKPRGLGVKATAFRGLLRRRPDVIVESLFAVHIGSYRLRGYDDEPVGLNEILTILTPRLETAEEEDYYHILVIHSPTGFTGKAVEYVSSPGRLGGASPNLTLYLVDPVLGEVYYNSQSSAAKANRWVAEPLIDDEKVNKVLSYLESVEAYRKALETPGAPMLLEEEVADELGVEKYIVRIAFERAARKGLGRIVTSGSGSTAFTYTRPPGEEKG